MTEERKRRKVEDKKWQTSRKTIIKTIVLINRRLFCKENEGEIEKKNLTTIAISFGVYNTNW